jgi:hypothetical protein
MPARRRALAATVAALSVLSAVTAPAPASGEVVATAPAAPPLITVTLTGGAMTVSGALRLPAGPVRFRLRSVGDEGHAMSVLRIKPGHTLAEVVADSDAAADDPRSAAAANLRRLADKVDFRGGIGVGPDRSATMTLRLEPGTYYISDQSDEGNRFKKVTITSRKGSSVPVRPKATVALNEHYRITGATTLPRKGPLRVRNTATTGNRLYIASLQRVRPGTTAEDVMRLRDRDADRSFLLPGGFDTGLLSPGREETLVYSMPAGTYALQCTLPSDSGVPHALNGMVRIVELT